MLQGKSKTAVALALAAAAVAYSGAAAAEQNWRRVGTLDCTMGPSIGLVHGDRQRARCTFSADKRRYAGKMSRPGLDLGIASGSKMIWTVFSRSASGRSAKSLVGSYAGACSDIAAAPSIGEKALSGGMGSVCLQPATAASNRRRNLASEITTLELE